MGMSQLVAKTASQESGFVGGLCDTAEHTGRPECLAPSAVRYHHLDSLRSILMLLGVVVHAAAIYVPQSRWLVRDEGYVAFRWLIDGIHAFRLPTFFTISGFFALFALQRHGKSKFVRVRLERIAVPLLTTALVINLPTYALLHGRGSHAELPLLPSVYEGFLRSGGWVEHLWFLNCLVVYVVVTYVAASLVRDTTWRSVAERLKFLGRGWALLLLPVLNLASVFIAHRVQDVFGDPPLVPFEWSELFVYAPFFAFGILIYHFRAAERDRVGQISAPTTLIASTAIGVLFAVPTMPTPLAEYRSQLVSWLLVLLCFAVFKKIANHESKAFGFLSDAAYTLYLVHHSMVIIVGMLLLGVAVHPVAKFGAVLAIASAASLAFHNWVVLRIPVVRYVMNGKR